ncbi:hypothetical protein KIH86_00355, partial [Paenibacillus sp. HN-1]
MNIISEEIQKLRERVELLIVTATEVETNAVVSALKPFTDNTELNYYYHYETYTIGVIGCYGAVH